jgi:hypothetical protein
VERFWSSPQPQFCTNTKTSIQKSIKRVSKPSKQAQGVKNCKPASRACSAWLACLLPILAGSIDVATSVWLHARSTRSNGYQRCLIQRGRENNLDADRRDHSVMEKTHPSSHEDMSKVNKQLKKIFGEVMDDVDLAKRVC